MNLNRYVNLTLVISAVYAGAIFLLEGQISSLLENQMPLLWATVSLSVINVGLLIYSFFCGRTITIRIILLNLVQLAIFCRLHIQIHDILGTVHYSYTSQPFLSDWMKFIGIHALNSLDLLDIVEGSRKISHQGILSGIALFSMCMMVGIFMLELIFKAVSFLSQIKNVSLLMKWVCRGGLAVAAVMVILAGRKHSWDLSNWFLWPLDNILRTLDIGDMFQIFGWQLHSLESGINSSGMAVFFRLMVGVYAATLAYRLYSRILEGPVRGVDELIAICASPEHSTRDRVLAINELEQFGSFADAAIPDLIKVMVSSNRTLRNAATQALKKIDPQWTQSETARKSVPKLLKLLRNDDTGIRITGAEVLGEFGPAAEKAVPDLVKVLTDSDIFKVAAQTLGKIGPVAIPDLIRVLGNEDEHVRHAAVRALEKIDPQWQQTEDACKETTNFVKDLEKVDGAARTSAVRALGEIGPAVAPHLVKLLADSDVRSLAIKALGEMGPDAEQAAVPHLINVLASRNEDVRKLGSRSLEKIAPHWRESEDALNAIPYFMNALREDKTDSDDLANPAEALVEIGPAAIQSLVEALADGNKEVFNIAARALKRIDLRWPQSDGAIKAVPHLAKALGNSQWFVRRAAAEVLGKIGPGAREAVPHLVKALADSNKKARSAIKSALDRVLLKNAPHVPEEEDEDASASDVQKEVVRLVKEMTDGSGAARSEAASALGEIGAAAGEAIPHLVKALGDSDQILRTEAALALGRIDSRWHQHESTLNTIPLFVKALAGADVGFNCGAPRDALTEIGTPTIRYLVEALAAPNKDVVNSAAKFLKKMDTQWPESEGAREAVPHLGESLGDSQWFVRHAAAKVLGKIGPRAIKAVPFLVRALADKNKEVRLTVKEALNKVTVKT